MSTLPTSLPVALLQVKTKSGKVELREERDKWLEELWEHLNSPGILECRWMWDEVMLFAPELKKEQFESSLIAKLETITHRDLNSYLLVSELVGPEDAKLKELDEMQLQLHKINYWEQHIFDYYYENGKQIELKEKS
ncbi:MAG: hypothetical protein Q3M30_14450 [Candidatus Electrothrix sp. Rat3]|nr:hypothetical protein [Candidatus Electrothrix rattekaaiensis]